MLKARIGFVAMIVNLSLPNVIFAILVIGVVGMALDALFARLQKAVTYAE